MVVISVSPSSTCVQIVSTVKCMLLLYMINPLNIAEVSNIGLNLFCYPTENTSHMCHTTESSLFWWGRGGGGEGGGGWLIPLSWT